MPRPKKKVILVLVEGETDQYALERPIAHMLEEIDESLEIAFLPAEGDLTSDLRNNPENILKKMEKFYLDPFFSGNPFYYPKDIIRVIHIVDTDGCFLPNSDLKLWNKEEIVKLPYYEPPYIYHNDIDFLCRRNKNKAANILQLLKEPVVYLGSKKPPYEIYYFSCNMDHCLSGAESLNICTREKIISASAFADANEFNSKLFLDVMKDYMPPLDEPTYDNTWDFITQGENSINRYTNLYIGLKKLVDDFKVDRQTDE